MILYHCCLFSAALANMQMDFFGFFLCVFCSSLSFVLFLFFSWRSQTFSLLSNLLSLFRSVPIFLPLPPVFPPLCRIGIGLSQQPLPALPLSQQLLSGLLTSDPVTAAQPSHVFSILCSLLVPVTRRVTHGSRRWIKVNHFHFVPLASSPKGEEKWWKNRWRKEQKTREKELRKKQKSNTWIWKK